MFMTQRGQEIYLVPSRCHEATLPKDFTKDANKMRDLRTHMITEPSDRYYRINNLIEHFAKANVLSQWQIKVQENFAVIKAKQLYHCKVLDPKGNQRDWSEYEGRRFPHTEPLQLKKNTWAIVYG